MSARKSLVALSLALLLVGCAGNAARQQQAADDYRAAAGPPVKSFFFNGTFYSWQPLDDHSLVVYTRPNKAWLLDVGSCPELPFTMSIGLSSSVDRVSVGFDKVLTGRGDFPCYITAIHPIDMDKVHAAQVKRRQVESVPRAQAAPRQ